MLSFGFVHVAGKSVTNVLAIVGKPVEVNLHISNQPKQTIRSFSWNLINIQRNEASSGYSSLVSFCFGRNLKEFSDLLSWCPPPLLLLVDGAILDILRGSSRSATPFCTPTEMNAKKSNLNPNLSKFKTEIIVAVLESVSKLASCGDGCVKEGRIRLLLPSATPVFNVDKVWQLWEAASCVTIKLSLTVHSAVPRSSTLTVGFSTLGFVVLCFFCFFLFWRMGGGGGGGGTSFRRSLLGYRLAHCTLVI